MLHTYSALRDMAKRSNDAAAENLYNSKIEKIHRNFHLEGVGLWINKTGHPAAWREEIRLRRLRPDPWSYSGQILLIRLFIVLLHYMLSVQHQSVVAVFVPIDAGLLRGLEAVQALHYTEYGLERIRNDTYGEFCDCRILFVVRSSSPVHE